MKNPIYNLNKLFGLQDATISYDSNELSRTQKCHYIVWPRDPGSKKDEGTISDC